MDVRRRVLVGNERVKTISSALANLATALFAASAAKLWADCALGLFAALWLIGSAALMGLALSLQGLLKPEA